MSSNPDERLLKGKDGSGIGLYGYEQVKYEGARSIVGTLILGLMIATFGAIILLSAVESSARDKWIHWWPVIGGSGILIIGLFFCHMPVIYLFRRITYPKSK